MANTDPPDVGAEGRLVGEWRVRHLAKRDDKTLALLRHVPPISDVFRNRAASCPVAVRTAATALNGSSANLVAGFSAYRVAGFSAYRVADSSAEPSAQPGDSRLSSRKGAL